MLFVFAAFPSSALLSGVLGLRVVGVAWFCILVTGFGFFTFGIICDLQINELGSLSKISAQITVNHNVLCLLNTLGAMIFAFFLFSP